MVGMDLSADYRGASKGKSYHYYYHLLGYEINTVSIYRKEWLANLEENMARCTPRETVRSSSLPYRRASKSNSAINSKRGIGAAENAA